MESGCAGIKLMKVIGERVAPLFPFHLFRY
jgi:hypothetical protein